MKTKYNRPIGIVILNFVLQSSFYLFSTRRDDTIFWPLGGFKICSEKAYNGGYIEINCETNVFYGYDFTELVVYSVLIPLAVFAISLIIRR